MKNVTRITICLSALLIAVFVGCGKKADETKPLSEVKAEAETMDVAKLKAMAEKYKESLMAKEDEVAKLMSKMKEIPLADIAGQESKDLKAEIDNLSKSVSALKARFKVYYNKLKEKGGDVSGLGL